MPSIIKHRLPNGQEVLKNRSFPGNGCYEPKAPVRRGTGRIVLAHCAEADLRTDVYVCDVESAGGEAKPHSNREEISLRVVRHLGTLMHGQELVVNLAEIIPDKDLSDLGISPIPDLYVFRHTSVFNMN